MIKSTQNRGQSTHPLTVLILKTTVLIESTILVQDEVAAEVGLLERKTGECSLLTDTDRSPEMMMTGKHTLLTDTGRSPEMMMTVKHTLLTDTDRSPDIVMMMIEIETTKHRTLNILKEKVEISHLSLGEGMIPTMMMSIIEILEVLKMGEKGSMILV